MSMRFDRRTSAFIASLLILASPLAAQSEEAGGYDDETPYLHPLQGAPILDGRAAAVELLDAGPGQRYFVFESALQDSEDGELEIDGGVGIAEVRPLTAERRAELARLTGKQPAGSSEERVRPKIDTALQSLIDGAAAGETATVVVTFEPPPAPPISHLLEVAVAHGEIETQGDFRWARSGLVQERANRLLEASQPIRDLVVELGGAILGECGVLPCVIAELPLETVARLAEIPEVNHLMPDYGVEENGDGVDSRDGAQITHVVADFDGEGPTTSVSDDVWGGIIESELPRYTHYVFHDSSSTTSNRHYVYDCTDGTCGGPLTGSYGFHATAVGSTVYGDVEDGQIDGVSGVAASGMAPEAKVYFYRTGKYSYMTAAWSHIPTRVHQAHAVNMSISLENHPPYDCSGDDGTSDLADAFFETGSLLVMAAGNDGGSSSECRVEMPGSALSVFTIGGHGSSGGYDAGDVRNGDIHGASAWGGTYKSGSAFWTMGRGRTIIDLTAHYSIGNRATTTSDTALGGFFNGTSAAAPQVTGFALDFVDFYKNTWSDFIDNPGSLASNLTILGDRAQPGTSTERTWGFDNRFGAGRLKARRFDAVGLDGPAYYFNGWTCISDGEEWVVDLKSGTPFANDFDDLKAVIWWYDPGFHRGETLDDVDLYLETADATSIKYSNSSFENREMVQYTDIGNFNQDGLRLRLLGYNVTEDNVGCGTDSMKVFFTVYAEDGDREATENLGGVERM